jgi:hypothetical protein
MQMEFDSGVLILQNASGRRWQLANIDKPRLSFPYDALSVTKTHALRRVGSNVQPLTRREIEEVTAFISAQTPPPPHEQLAADLKTFAHGLINAAVGRLRFGNLLEAQIAARESSTDLRADDARHVLAYVDMVWNSYHGVEAQIDATPEDELAPFADYCNMMPMLPDLHQLRAKAADGSRTSTTVEPTQHNGAHASPAEPGMSEDVPASAPTSAEPPGRLVSLETRAPEAADFSSLVDRVFVFDDFFPAAQLKLYEKWALQTPHWMLSNSSHDAEGNAKHRIWGASFIEPWRRKGWSGLPPVLFSLVAGLFRKLDVTIIEPEYIGLNGQSKDQTASMHTDCAHDSPDDMSILVYLGEDTDGDLLLYDKANTARLLHRIAYRPNRVIVFDGSIPHQALAPTEDKFRMSVIIRGKYKLGATDLSDARGGG